MTSFFVERVEPLHLNMTTPLSDMRTFAPFVWQTTYGFEMLLSATPRNSNQSSIFHGVSSDGVLFALDRYPVIAARGSSDGYQDACVVRDQARYIVYYGALSAAQSECRIELATSVDIHELLNAAAPSIYFEGQTMIRPQIVEAGHESWRLFFEQRDGATSSIGCARASTAQGPWNHNVIVLERRAGKWDGMAVTTGPITRWKSGSVIFYGGSDDTAEWHVGWALLDDGYDRITERCDAALLPADDGNLGKAGLLGASAVPIGAQIWLYAFGSERPPFRAILREP